MKKSMYLAAAAIAMIGLASCNSKDCKGGKCEKIEDQTYTGILPAADCPGIQYTLKLDYEDDKNNMEGDYDLVETYLEADSVASSGVKNGKSFTSEGDFTVVEQNGKKYLKLVKDAKDSSADATASLNFEVTNDSTLTMVNAQLEPAVSDSLNYTLKLVK